MTTTALPSRDRRDPAPEAGPAHPLRSLQERINDAFEEMWQKIGSQHVSVSGRAHSGPLPRADLSAGSEDLRVELELPGLDDADIEVELDGRTLTVRGEKRVEREAAGRTYILAERASGRFARSFRLPPEVDAERIAASFRNGVLTVKLPKKAGAAAQRTIPIHGK